MIEKRIYTPVDKQELRAYTENNEKIIAGYAAKYSVLSRILHEDGRIFNEMLMPGAFRDVLSNDVILTFNHLEDKVFARTVNKTLVLEEDEKGLKFRAILNDTNDANDLYKMVERGDVFENSFAFTVDKEGQEWSRSSNGDPIRKISRISELYDVSVVTRAAYPETEVYTVRGLDKYFEEPKPKTIEINKEPYEDMVHILKIK